MRPLTDVRWLEFVVVLIILAQQALCISAVDCNRIIIVGNSTHNTKGAISSTDFPSLLDSTYTCEFEFQTDTPGDYLELIFTDFIMDDPGTCRPPGFTFTVLIRESRSKSSVRHCERPKRHVFPLNGPADVAFKSRTLQKLRTFRATYRFLPSTEGERLSRQTTHEVTLYNYDVRDNYQGSITDEIDYNGKEVWVDVLQYIRAPVDHKVAFTAAFMQAHQTTSLEIHDGATSLSDQLLQSQSSSREKHTTSQDWVYVRWYGEAGGAVNFDIDFTFFRDPGSSGVCAGDYFKCTNDLCIPSKLLCNGVDNCYDDTTRNDEDPQGECRDPCELEPCLHFARCISSGLSFRCECPRNYLGFTCEKPPGQSNDTNSCGDGTICRNGGTCVSNVCVCPEGYTGPVCEIFGDGGTVSGTCAEECLNGGSCNANNECQCAQGYFGPHCEYVDNTGGGPDYTDLQHTSIMIGAFVGAVCLLSICWLIAMARKRQTDTQPEGRLQRIISVHSPDESIARRQSTMTRANVELPPNYSEAILFREGSFKTSQHGPQMPSNRRISADEPLSPPPSYDAVASDNEDEGIVFRIPATVPEDDDDEEEYNNAESGQALHILSDNNTLPDVVTSQENNSQNSTPTMTRHDTPV